MTYMYVYVSEVFVNGGVLTTCTILRGRTAYRWKPLTTPDPTWMPPGGLVI